MGTSILSVPGPTSERVEADVQLALGKISNAKTFGSTSVLERLRDFTKRIQLMEKTLREHEQDAVCVFTVGDIPSDSSNQSSEIIKHAFVEGLLKFSRLPVQIVIRVCTDDEHVAEFYHNLRLQLPLIVMGKFEKYG